MGKKQIQYLSWRSRARQVSTHQLNTNFQKGHGKNKQANIREKEYEYQQYWLVKNKQLISLFDRKMLQNKGGQQIMCPLTSIHFPLLSHGVLKNKLGKSCLLLAYNVHLIKKIFILKASLPRWKDILIRVLQCVEWLSDQYLY